jgi:hypothetical protein
VKRWLSFLVPGILGCALIVSVSFLVHAAPVTWSYAVPEDALAASGATTTHENIAARVQAVYQGDPQAGWDSPEQYQEWWPSACSAFAMYAVLRAFGVKTRPGLVLDDEIMQRAITSANGLISLESYANLVPRWYGGLDSTYYYHMQTSHIRQIVAAGLPVLVNIWDPQAYYYHFEPGHWLVVVGYSSHSSLADHVPAYLLRDSSGYHLSWIKAEAFEYLFNTTHRAVVVHRLREAVP